MMDKQCVDLSKAIGVPLSRDVSLRLVALICVAMIAFLLGIAPSMAATCSNPSNHYYTIPLPSKVAVPRDLPVGSAITGWNGYVGDARHWTCSRDGNDTTGSILTVSRFTKRSGTTYSGLTVWETDVPGVGIAYYTYLWFSTDSGAGNNFNWLDKSSDLSDDGTAVLGISGMTTGPGNTSWHALGSRMQAILVKTGPVKPGTITAGGVAFGYPYMTSDGHYGGGGYDTTYSIGSVAIIESACKTPDVAVDLGSHASSAFPAVGSRSAAVKFNLGINDCPANFNSVSYKFTASAGTDSTPSKGLFSLTADSVARGVQVKLMQGDGTTTVELQKSYPLNGYVKTTGGSYLVPLSAAYERIGDVTPGPANAELMIEMLYQ